MPMEKEALLEERIVAKQETLVKETEIESLLPEPVHSLW